ncbi:hypothetical protein OG455_20490 [Kitasatospora sp. NBC_01287]|uniref:hypothetical protein n=1 Tax=Kitasatospora sp. NBC_01287 TaxID=2903573 RepID=UPI00224CCC2F|nr:hypothetical protein [Kitasatospora sp. NBC_01287]MCX4747866.1 hypothetical protein [Kitasatospora sp. NBC_01287]
MSTPPEVPARPEAPDRPEFPDRPEAPDRPAVAEQPASAVEGPADGTVRFDVLVDPFSATVPPQAAPRPARRRGRIVLPLVGALLLGPLLGGGIGYAIQARRPPTPLPPLQPAAAPGYPVTRLNAQVSAALAPEPLPIDGDLRPLLLPKPDGAQDWDDFQVADPGDWESAGQLADEDGLAAKDFQELLTSGFRRAVMNCWEQNGVKYRVQLVQYFSDNSASAIQQATAARSGGTPFADGLEGGFHADSTPSTYFETNDQFYYAAAVTRRGDLVVRVEAFGTAQVSADSVRDLAEQQWERLA